MTNTKGLTVTQNKYYTYSDPCDIYLGSIDTTKTDQMPVDYEDCYDLYYCVDNCYVLARWSNQATGYYSGESLQNVIPALAIAYQLAKFTGYVGN